MLLNKKKHYLQIALNSTPSEGRDIISQLPSTDRIIVEAGTPLIKAYGVQGIRSLKSAWQQQNYFQPKTPQITKPSLSSLFFKTQNMDVSMVTLPDVYIVADTKCMDRGKTEVQIALDGGASAATVLGAAPIETIDYFIASCQELGLDSMVDFIGVEQPVKILRKLKKMPTVVVLHRGVDEERFNKSIPVPFLQINKIRSSYDVLISIAGGDTIREVQSAVFNDANIVVVWKNFYAPSSDTGTLANQFLAEIK